MIIPRPGLCGMEVNLNDMPSVKEQREISTQRAAPHAPCCTAPWLERGETWKPQPLWNEKSGHQDREAEEHRAPLPSRVFFFTYFSAQFPRTSQSLFRKLNAYPLGEVSQTPSSAHLKQSASERLETHPAPQIHGLTVTWKVNPLPLFSKTQFHPA